MMKNRSVALGALMVMALSALAGGEARAQVCAVSNVPCPTLCAETARETATEDAPIHVLYLGSSTPPAWFTTAMTTLSGDCSGCAFNLDPNAGPVDFTVRAITWSTARTWTTEQFRAFDVLLFDNDSSVAFPGPLLATDPWVPLFDGNRRAVATGLHLPNHVTGMNSFREFTQNVVAWLADDECCEVPAGQGVLPGIFIADDFSSPPFAYSQWQGLANAYSTGPCHACVGLAQWDDVTMIGSHPIHANINAAACGCLNNVGCSLDGADQSVHRMWQAGMSCGYERDEFVSVLAMNTTSSACRAIRAQGCLTGTEFAGEQVTLVRDMDPDATCCHDVSPRPVLDDGDCTCS